jgi:hypothetical protein
MLTKGSNDDQKTTDQNKTKGSSDDLNVNQNQTTDTSKIKSTDVLSPNIVPTGGNMIGKLLSKPNGTDSDDNLFNTNNNSSQLKAIWDQLNLNKAGRTTGSGDTSNQQNQQNAQQNTSGIKLNLFCRN